MLLNKNKKSYLIYIILLFFVFIWINLFEISKYKILKYNNVLIRNKLKKFGVAKANLMVLASTCLGKEIFYK